MIVVLTLMPLNLFAGSPGTSFDPSQGFGRTVLLADFAEDSGFQIWNQMNDPVMGGESYGTFDVDEARGVGIFRGRVNIVPSLNAPGFIKAETIRPFEDISSCQAIAVTANASNTYAGYRFSVGSGRPIWGRFFAFGYKADYFPGMTMSPVLLPLNQFTNYWDDATGNAIVTCEDNHWYCIPARTLRNIGKMEIWAEGVEGDVYLEIRKIEAVQC